MFNELSLLHKAATIEGALTILEQFAKSCIRANEIGLGDLRLHENYLSNLYNIPIHDNYNVDIWLKDNRVNEDLRNRFKEILTSYPLIHESEIDQSNQYKISEFYKKLDGRRFQVWGLGAAYIFGTFSLSLPTHEEWYKSEIEIEHYFLDNNLEEKIKPITVKHFSSIDHINDHLAWWEQYQLDNLEKSEELWTKRKEIFPNLEFCEEVESQLKKLGASKILYQVIDRLNTLNNYVKNWKDGAFNYDDVNKKTNLRISPESELTLNKFGTLRKFTIPSQGKKIFDLHIKTGILRFHFYPDDNTQKVYIGYIGKHLRIASEG
jgi:hypothetical protein